MTIDLEAADCKGYLDVFFFHLCPSILTAYISPKAGASRNRKWVAADCAKWVLPTARSGHCRLRETSGLSLASGMTQGGRHI